ncbi:MAG: hypothetical protein R3B84_23880 [Zavarzinella sp.]
MRFQLLGFLFAIGSVIGFVLFFSVDELSLRRLAEGILAGIGGPIWLSLMVTNSSPVIFELACILGWLGFPAMFAHPIFQNTASKVVTVIGTICWFISGFMALVYANAG